MRSQHMVQRRRGSSLMEFALVVPIFFLVVLGSIYICIIGMGYSNMIYACRLAVRYAVVHGSGSTKPCSVTDLQNIITPAVWMVPSPVVKVSWSPDTDSNSGVVTIAISSNLPGIPLTAVKSIPITVSGSGSILQ